MQGEKEKKLKVEEGETRRGEEGSGRIRAERKTGEVEGMGELESKGEVWGGEVESQTSEVEEVTKCIYVWLYTMVIIYFLYERLVVLGNQ